MKTKKRNTRDSSKNKPTKVLDRKEITKIKSVVLMLNKELNRKISDVKRLNLEIKETHKDTIIKSKELEKISKKQNKTEHNIQVLKDEINQKNKEINKINHELSIRDGEIQLEKKHNIKETEELRRVTREKEKELDAAKHKMDHIHKRFSMSIKKIEDKDFELIRLGQKIRDSIDENRKLRELIRTKDGQVEVLKQTVVKKNRIIHQLNKEMDEIK